MGLEEILIKLAKEEIRLAHALTEALPLLRGILIDADYQWAVSEQSGYPPAEGDTGFENGLPPHIPEYRQIFASGINL